MGQVFKKKAMGNEEDQKGMIEELKKQFGDHYKRFKEKNDNEWKVDILMCYMIFSNIENRKYLMNGLKSTLKWKIN